MEITIEQIPLEEIEIPPGQRELDNLDELMDSILTLGLLQPILVTQKPPHYRLVAGWRQYNAYKRIGRPAIQAIILSVDDLLEELTKIDENMVRQELTTLEHAEQVARRKEIYETLHPETRHGNGPGRGRREKKRNEFGSFADDTASKTGRTARTIQQAVQIARSLSDNRTKELIRLLPIADKKIELLRLMRLPRESQEAIAALLASGGGKSICEAQRALDAVPQASTPTTRRSPRGQISAPEPAGVKGEGKDRDTLR
jgi:ParB family chromosome partitioning protein